MSTTPMSQNDEHKQRMLKVQANGAPTEWVWSCEAETAEEANRAVAEHMDANDWKLQRQSACPVAGRG